VRDASFFGTPVVLVGERQHGRETDVHAVRVPPIQSMIVEALEAQLAHGRYASSTLYGELGTSEAICDALAKLQPYVQKRLHYVMSDGLAGGHYDRESAFAASR